MDILLQLRCIETMNTLSRWLEDDPNIADESCRILLRFSMNGSILKMMLIVENDCQRMYEEGGIDLLLNVCKKCIGNEETVRMACQVLRVITAADGCHMGVS